MSKIKKIKIYTHHRRYFDMGLGAVKKVSGLPHKITSAVFVIFYYVGLVVIKTFDFLKNTIIGTCFQVGNIIMGSITKTFRALKNDVLKTREFFPQRFKLLLNLQFKRSLLSFLIFAAIGWGAIESLHLVARALDIKGKIMRTAFIGNFYLSQAKDALTAQDLNQAQSRFALAYQTFNNGEKQIEESGQLLNSLLNLVPQKNDADRLLAAASLISQAGQNFITLENSLKTLKLTPAGIVATEKSTNQVVLEIGNTLSQAQNKITLASSNINKVNVNSVPAQNKISFLDLKSKLAAAELALNNFAQIFAVSKNLLLGNKNILLVFENNNELRASGGFMGTYGDLTLKNGAITKINVSSIYDLDGQLQDIIQPPHPVLNLSDRWYLRDSNWFANFPDSAKKIAGFYEKEGGQTPNVIIAITPNIIVDWLKITGPVELAKYHITLTAENFVEQTQAAATITGGLPTNEPKQILADLVPVLLERISQLDKSALPNLIQGLQDNLNNKQIVIYSRDPETQKQLQAFHWTGELSPTDRDYLSVVTSNLGGTKTDLYVDQQLELTSNVASDGTVTNELSITRTNKMPKLPGTNNLSFLRVYAPLGAKLISNIGFDYKNLDYPVEEKYKADEDVYNWEKNSVQDVLTGTTIGVESSKTFFGNWLNVDGGETKIVKLVYQLPFKVNDIDRYSLTLQKQIGAQNQKFNWNFNFPNYQIAWKNFDPDTLNTNNLNSDIIMDKDYFLGMVLQKR